MPLTPSWADIGLRLLLTVIAGALIGLNRGEHGHPAGLRTTLLVGLAASLSMILANLLLDTSGKPDGSFAVLDLMRLPLGILTGVGFIGAGAIIRRGDGVEGVTTAATLWFVTMVGLCLGGGQLVLGSVATAIGLAVLIALKALENRVPSERRATIELILDGGEMAEDLVAAKAPAGYRVVEHGASREGGRRHLRYEIQWSAPANDPGPGEFVARLASAPGVVKVMWRLGAP
ncbi:MAG TPA: MgtC/SapB family protein [Stellaceae bacterium]|nr:MgtC/SapB family protein [Stellaceae bacterium]